MKIDKLKKHLSSIDKISEKLKLDLKPIQTDFAKFIGKKKQYINSFCLGKRQVSNKELLFLLEQYEKSFFIQKTEEILYAYDHYNP